MEEQMPGIIICAGFIGFFGLFFGTRTLTRYFQHKEKMAMIERGMLAPDDVVRDVVERRNGNGRRMFVWGVGVTLLGLAVICGFMPLIVTDNIDDFGDFVQASGPFLIPGLFIIFLGVGLIIMHYIAQPESEAEPAAETPDLHDLENVIEEESPQS